MPSFLVLPVYFLRTKTFSYINTIYYDQTLASPLDSKEIKPVNPKGNGRTDAEALKLWTPDAKSQLSGKDPDAGKDWGQSGVTEDEMVGYHHWLNGHEFEQTPG